MLPVTANETGETDVSTRMPILMDTPTRRGARQSTALCLALALSTAGLLSACSSDTPSAPVSPPTVDLGALATLTAGDVSGDAMLRLTGTVDALDRTTLVAQTQARVAEITVDVGDRVAPGELLLRFNDTEARAQLAAAQAQLAAARAQLTEARLQHDRVKDVYDRQLVAQAQYDHARAALDGASAQAAAAEAQLAAAQEGLAHTLVKAPFAAQVLSRRVDVGTATGYGQPLLELVGTQQLRVLVDLPGTPSDVAALSAADLRIVTTEGDELVPAALRISPSTTAASQTVRVIAELPSSGLPASIVAGTLVEVRIAKLAGTAGNLWLPQAALIRRGELEACFVVHEGRLQMRSLRTGAHSADGRVEILAGLRADETIAADGRLAQTLYHQASRAATDAAAS